MLKLYLSTYGTIVLSIVYIHVVCIPWYGTIVLCTLYINVVGIPWYGTIVLCTAGLRLMISLPAQTTSQKVTSKRYLLFKEMEEIVIPSLRRATDQ